MPHQQPGIEPATATADDTRPGHDPAGTMALRVHQACGSLYLFGLATGTAGKDLLAIPLLIVAVWRWPAVVAGLPTLLSDRLVQGMVGWLVLLSLSLLWSPDPAMGLEHVAAFRAMAISVTLWPLMARPGPLVGGFVAGSLVQVAVQTLQWQELLGFRPGFNDRLPGLMHPIRTAGILTAACLWCLSAAATVPGRRPRLVGGLLLVAAVTAAGVVMTGSRGPWIGFAAGLAALVAILLRWSPGSHRRIAIGGAVLLVAGGLLAPAAWNFLATRVAQARADLAAAGEGAFTTDVGFRIASYRVAIELAGERPLLGHGAGSFAVEAPRVAPDLAWDGITHAHSTWLTAAMETGWPSAALVLGLLSFAAVRAWRSGLRGPLAAGTFGGLVAWMVAAAFDTPHHSGTMNGLLQFTLLLLVAAAAARDARPAPGSAVGDPA
jgi:O-antigen ligase